MAAPFICLEIPTLKDPLQLTLPGGVTIEHVNLLDMVQPALAPLVPVFNIVDAVVALFNCFKAIPDALLSLNPQPILECLPDLAKKVQELLKLIPQLSLPLTIIGLVDLVIDTLEQAKDQLVHLQRQMQRILEVVDRAKDLNDAGLFAISACAETNVAQEARNVGKNLASLGKLIGLINLFAGMVGAPTVPDLSNVAGQPLDKAIEPIDALVDTLKVLRNSIPIP